ncbi:MAG: ATP cone domain-containing protein, partial [Dehalococcoidia bacterium]
MRCPYCDHDDSRVTDSRTAPEGIRRRRECLACGRRFSTLERVQVGELLVAKKDGRREPFSREKVLIGVRKACQKRPIAAAVMEALADAVETAAAALGRAEVPTSFIGELVMERL